MTQDETKKLLPKLGVYFREFPDGEYELGVLEESGMGHIMDVSDFAYSSYLDERYRGIQFKEWLGQWTYIGEL